MKYENAISIQYSPVNNAWFILWHSQVLAVFFNKWEAVEYLKRLKVT